MGVLFWRNRYLMGKSDEKCKTVTTHHFNEVEILFSQYWLFDMPTLVAWVPKGKGWEEEENEPTNTLTHSCKTAIISLALIPSHDSTRIIWYYPKRIWGANTDWRNEKNWCAGGQLDNLWLANQQWVKLRVGLLPRSVTRRLWTSQRDCCTDAWFLYGCHLCSECCSVHLFHSWSKPAGECESWQLVQLGGFRDLGSESSVWWRVSWCSTFVRVSFPWMPIGWVLRIWAKLGGCLLSSWLSAAWSVSYVIGW